MVLESAYEWLAICWHLLRSDEIALTVQNYRRTEIKNKRHKQVCHCLLNIYKLVVNSVNWESKIWNPLFPVLRGSHWLSSLSRHTTFKTLISLIILPLPETAAHQFSSHAPFYLQKSTDNVRSNGLQSQNPSCSQGVFRQNQLQLRHVCTWTDRGTLDASGHSNFW